MTCWTDPRRAGRDGRRVPGLAPRPPRSGQRPAEETRQGRNPRGDGSLGPGSPRPVLASADGGLECSSACSRDAVDSESGVRRRETPRLPGQSGCWTSWTGGAFVDAGRLTHNPEVAGSKPAPATNFRRSGPFPSEGRAFCVPGAVVKRVVETGFRAAWRRDGGDGTGRGETAWTGWTLPLAIAGRLAQR